MSPVEQLDYILKAFCNNAFFQGRLTDGEIDSRINLGDDPFRERIIPLSDLTRVLNKLVLDGYLHRDLNSNNTHTYSITWEGQYFTANDGYAGKLRQTRKEEEEIKNIRDRQLSLSASTDASQKSMTTLTRWIVAGTIISALYYIIQMIDYLVKMVGCCSCHH